MREDERSNSNLDRNEPAVRRFRDIPGSVDLARHSPRFPVYA